MAFMDKIKAKAREDVKKVVLPEGTDERVLKAARTATDEGIAHIILTGSREDIEAKAEECGVSLEG